MNNHGIRITEGMMESDLRSRLTAAALDIVANLAREEARQLGKIFVEPEHILLAICNSDQCDAYRLLNKLNVPPHEVREQIQLRAQKFDGHRPDPVCMSYRPLKLLDTAAEEANAMSGYCIGSLHLLVALVQQSGLPTEVLSSKGLSLQQLRTAIQEGQF